MRSIEEAKIGDADAAQVLHQSLRKRALCLCSTGPSKTTNNGNSNQNFHCVCGKKTENLFQMSFSCGSVRIELGQVHLLRCEDA